MDDPVSDRSPRGRGSGAGVLLRTKLYVPLPRPDQVLRPRLVEQLRAGGSRKLTLVAAPAGSGKTALVSEWAVQCGRAVAWVSLEPDDDDPTRFWTYVLEALRTTRPDLGEKSLALLRSSRPPPIERILAGLIDEVAALPEDLALILDDYHEIAAQPIHHAMSFLIEHLPRRLQLVVATRTDPPLGLPRLRARNQLIEVRASDLRFRTEEIAAFLEQAVGPRLVANDVEALEARTEGWIVGLQLAALSLREREDVSGFIRALSGSTRYVLDYLTEEVLDRQPEAVQHFLLETSIPRRLSGPLCDTLTGGGDGRESLRRLEQANLFLVPLDDERRWYRYHHLFADLLRSRLDELSPERARQLHRLASEWYEREAESQQDHGLLGEAVWHALEGRDLERAADLTDQATTALLHRGDLATLVSWLDRLSDDLVLARPHLALVSAYALVLTSRLDAAQERLSWFERQLAIASPEAAPKSSGEHSAGPMSHERPPLSDRRPDFGSDPVLRGLAVVVHSVIAYFRGDSASAGELARRALELIPEDQPSRRAQAVVILGLARWSLGDVEAAREAFVETVDVGRRGGNHHAHFMALGFLGQLEELGGDLARAESIYRDGLDFVASQGEPAPPASAWIYLFLGRLLYERNCLGEAASYLAEGLELSQRLGNPRAIANGYLALAALALARGDEQRTRELLRDAERAEIGYRLAPQVTSWRERVWVRLQLALGDLTSAARWTRERGLTPDDELSYQQEGEYLGLARVLIAQGRAREGLKLLDRLARAAEGAGRVGSAIEALVLEARAHQERGDVPSALVALERALGLAEGSEYVRVFVDEGPPMLSLLRQAAARGVHAAQVERLLAAFGVAGEPSVSGREGLVEPISERELEVLRLLAAGLSGTEIAERLVIAPSTARSHLKSLYAKLDVHSRAEAITRARDAKLL